MDIRAAIDELGLTPSELAVEMRVHPRTVKRWINGMASGPVAECLRCWLILHRAGTPFLPGSISVWGEK